METNIMHDPLVAPQFGTYPSDDVQWLLKDLSNINLEVSLEERENIVQNGGHYAEQLPIEYAPSDEYVEIFKNSLIENASKIAHAIAMVSEQVLALRGEDVVLVSLARAGTPIGVLMHRYFLSQHNLNVPHYAVSIIRGRGIDYNAMKYISTHHNPENIIFIDGWTGKGAIAKELTQALEVFKKDTGIKIPDDLAVLADTAHSVNIYGTREDYLIPSACLNSTVSGLISRTVLRKDLIKENDYHGAKFYSELIPNDLSLFFINSVEKHFNQDLKNNVLTLLKDYTPETPDWRGWATVENISREYGINNVNLVKPGVGETTRVMLRRVPWKILINPHKIDDLNHIILLAEERKVPLEEYSGSCYSCIGLVHPEYTPGATGFDGKGTTITDA